MASPSSSDWRSSSGHSQALKERSVSPDVFWGSSASSVRFSPYVAHSGGVSDNLLPSALVGQLVGIGQMVGVCIGDSEVSWYMTRSANVMYDTRPPSPHRPSITLGDG